MSPKGNAVKGPLTAVRKARGVAVEQFQSS